MQRSAKTACRGFRLTLSRGLQRPFRVGLPPALYLRIGGCDAVQIALHQVNRR